MLLFVLFRAAYYKSSFPGILLARLLWRARGKQGTGHYHNCCCFVWLWLLLFRTARYKSPLTAILHARFNIKALQGQAGNWLSSQLLLLFCVDVVIVVVVIVVVVVVAVAILLLFLSLLLLMKYDYQANT